MIPDFINTSFKGRLVADPKKFTTKFDKILCRFTVACNRRIGKGEEKTSYLPVLVVGQEGANCLEYLSKGREVHITGATFETDNWEDKAGIKRESFTFVVSRGGTVTFGSSGRNSENSPTSDSNSSARDKITNKLKRDSGI